MQKPEPPRRLFLRHLLGWFVGLPLGLLLLRGRYDFSLAGGHAQRSYLSSAFYLTLTLPVVFYLLRATPLRHGLRHGLFGAVFVIFTLPWRWLKLHRHEAYPPTAWRWRDPEPKLSAFPKAFFEPGFPHDKLFFLGLAGAFAVLAILICYRGLHARRSSLKAAAREVLPGIVGYAVICVQAFMHTSIRSGYSLNAFLVYAPERQNWYLTRLFPAGNGVGFVSSDLQFWWGLDAYFQGIPKLPPTMLLRRSFVQYLGSQLSFFINPYLVYLALNTLFWFGAAAASYKVTHALTQQRRAALYVGALVCIGNGFIYFVGQPFAYVGGYACIAFVPFVFARFLAEEDAFSWLRVIPAALGLGLCALTYDVFPALLAILGFALLLRRGRLRTLTAIVLGVVLYGAFIYLQFFALGLKEDTTNSYLIRDAARGIRTLIETRPKGLLYQLTVTFVARFGQSIAYAFELVVVVLAGLGLWFKRHEQPKLGRIFLLLMGPSVFAGAYFHYGRVSWNEFPMIELARIYYVAFLAIYLGAALALCHLREWLETTRLRKHSDVVVWCAFFLLAFWQNADAFGFLSPAFHFYFANHGPWLDAI